VIETVLGPIRGDQLGAASTNEHLLTDSRGLVRPTREGDALSGPMRPEILGDLRWSYLSLPDNLTLDDPDVATDELAAAAEAGLSSIVEATSWGMGPRHADLPEISRRAGVHIVSAYGGYIDRTMPSWWRELDESGYENAFATALHDAVPGTGFRAGLLGLLGTSSEITASEGRMLRAAARAASGAGAAVSIRLDAAARRGPEVADLLARHGADPGRILFCNIDKVLERDYVRAVVDTGAVVEFAFGSENAFSDRGRDATDAERIAFLLDLLSDRPAAAITLSCSVWTKGQLTRHGGMGYGHVVRRVVPALRRAGVPEHRIADMLVNTPAALLDR
jgi:phosphotriesterase-related protein